MESPFLDWISDKRKPVLLKLLKLCDTINKYQAQAESRTHHGTKYLIRARAPRPLAARLRPQCLEEYVGQTHLLGEGKLLRRLIETDQLASMIFWGPPGVGKPL